MKRLLLLLVTSMLAKPIYVFNSSEEKVRFAFNLKQYRCLVCQNESLFDSDAPLALDLRQEIYQQIIAGKSNTEINKFLVSRYGNFIELKPVFSQHNSMLWLLPLIILGLWCLRLNRES